MAALGTGFVGGALLGTASVLLQIGQTGAEFNLSTHITPGALMSLGVIGAVWRAGAEWLLNGFFLLAGGGVFLASRLALQQGTLPRNWALLGIVVAVLNWLGFVAQLLGGVLLFQLVILVGGGILAPLWAVWLGRELGRS